MAFAVELVAPIGERTGRALVRRQDGCSMENVTTPVYPPSILGADLRGLRLDADLSQGEAAKLLGIGASQYSGLEHGRLRFIDGDDWNRAFALLREAGR